MRSSRRSRPAVRAILFQAHRAFSISCPVHRAGLPHSTIPAAAGDALPTHLQQPSSSPPYRFETGLSLFAKRTPRPFPPPFNSPPSGSFSDPLSTHDRSRDRRQPRVDGQLIRGHTNGDDAAYVSENMVIVNDGVGAWSTKKGGHAGLWSRLILHFWSLETENQAQRARRAGQQYVPDPVECLQRAYELTIEATSKPNQWSGTTTAAGAQLHFEEQKGDVKPVLYITNLGDSQVMVIRPEQQQLIYKTREQWHWFDCPRQLGTNSPDTPNTNAIMDKIEIQENDVVLAVSDGVIDNLWEHEIIENISDSVHLWENGELDETQSDRSSSAGMQFVADRLMLAAKKIAQDPFAESPFMERAVEEGLAMEGGKLDDISVIAALCQKAT